MAAVAQERGDRLRFSETWTFSRCCARTGIFHGIVLLLGSHEQLYWIILSSNSFQIVLVRILSGKLFFN